MCHLASLRDCLKNIFIFCQKSFRSSLLVLFLDGGAFILLHLDAQSLFEPANNKEVAEKNWWIDFIPTIGNGWWSDSRKDAWASLGKTCLGLSPHSSVSTVSINVLIDGEHPLHLRSSTKN